MVVVNKPILVINLKFNPLQVGGGVYHEETLEDNFSPEVNIAGSIRGSIWGSLKVQEGPLGPGRFPQ